MMLKNNIRHWWLLPVAGIAFFLTGTGILLFPFSLYPALSILFGALLSVIGAMKIVLPLSDTGRIQRRGWTLAMGILDMLTGILLLSCTGLSRLMLPFLLGCWVLVNGISIVSDITSLQIFNEPGRVWVIMGGVFTIIFTLLLTFSPVIGAITIVIWTAFAFIAVSIFYMTLSFRQKKIKRERPADSRTDNVKIIPIKGYQHSSP